MSRWLAAHITVARLAPWKSSGRWQVVRTGALIEDQFGKARSSRFRDPVPPHGPTRPDLSCKDVKERRIRSKFKHSIEGIGLFGMKGFWSRKISSIVAHPGWKVSADAK